VLWTYDGQYMRASASRGAPPAYAEFLEHGPIRPSHIQLQLLDRSPTGRLLSFKALPHRL
jgi:hypothetical protein